MSLFRVRDAIGYAVKAFRRHPWAFIGPCAAYSPMATVFALPMERVPDARLGLLGVAMFTFMALVLFLALGPIRASLKAYDGQPVHWRDAIDYSRPALAFGVVVLLVSAAATLGIFMLVLPGLLVLAWLGFALWVAADEGRAGKAALARALELTAGHRLRVLAVLFLLSLPSLGLSLLLPGDTPTQMALITVIETPMLVLYFHATTFMYRRLQGRREAIAA